MRSWPSALLFGLVVALCLAQVAWWIVFQFHETDRIERAGAHLKAGDVASALQVFDAGSAEELAAEARSRRKMFTYEGATLGLLVLTGVVFFYTALIRERHMRENQQRFLAGATHELKTPLTTVRLGLESLQQGSLPEARRASYLEGMLREVDRLERDLTNLLVAAGLESPGTVRQKAVRGDLADDVRRAVAQFRARCDAAGVECRIGELESCPVDRDEGSMRIVLHNLLDNAVKFNARGGHVDIDLKRHGHKARLVVSDDGCGIPKNELDRIFKRFHRGASHDHVGGTGLGLALVKELVEAHDGRVRAESDGPGQGARLTVDLPLAIRVEAA